MQVMLISRHFIVGINDLGTDCRFRVCVLGDLAFPKGNRCYSQHACTAPTQTTSNKAFARGLSTPAKRQ